MKQPEIILIHPPAISKRYMNTRFLPYGMSVIFSFLKEHSVPVRQYDFLMEYLFNSPEDIDFHNKEKTFSEKDFFDFLKGDSCHRGLRDFTEKYGNRIIPGGDIYAFSIIAYPQFWGGLLIANFIRKINSQAVIVFGGPFITIKPPEFFTGYDFVNYWVRGNGEFPLLKLYELRKGKKKIEPEKISGIFCFNEGKLISNNPAVTESRDERPPDFEGLFLDNYRYINSGKKNLFVPYRISKGCSSNCSFCTGRLVAPYDLKPPDKIIRELKFLSGKYESDYFMFSDSAINGNPGFLEKLCNEIIKCIPHIKWYAYGKVRGFTTDLLEHCRNAGCFALSWGVESISPETINLLNKNYNMDSLNSLLNKSISLGIKNYIHLMYNTPFETEKDIELLSEFIEKYGKYDNIIFSPMRFYLEPQSMMAENPEFYGLKNIKKADVSILGREHYLFDEIEGLSSEEITKRNEYHKKLLEPYLELIDSYKSKMPDTVM